MSFDEFRASIAGNGPPPGNLSLPLLALWHDGRGDWDAAHSAAQQDERNQDGAWVHAYLHRKEGDLGNAGYWYARAARTMPPQNVSLPDEWEAIARVLLG